MLGRLTLVPVLPALSILGTAIVAMAGDGADKDGVRQEGGTSEGAKWLLPV
jgi:hypothetical protein